MRDGLQITIDLLDGVGARDDSAYVVEKSGLEVRRVLNRPSMLLLKLLLLNPQVVVPKVGAAVVVARKTGEKLFTGALSSMDYEYLGWGEQGPVYEFAITALSAEATVGPAVVPGALAGATTVSAGAQLQSQAVGTAAAATFSDGAAPAGFAAGIQLPAVEVAAEASAMDVLESVASQAR